MTTDAAVIRPRLLARQGLPRAPRQQRSLDKRERLKDAALVLFGEKGYERTSIDDIAGRAGFAVGGFYRHFRSKRQLLLVLMDELLEQVNRLDLRLREPHDARTALHDVLAAAFARDLRYLGAYRAWEEAVLSDPQLARKHKAIRAWTTARVQSVFTALARLPGARQGLDVAALARAMDLFFWGLLAQAVRMRRAELDEWVDTATHLIYHAVFTDPLTVSPPAAVRPRG